VRPVATPTAQVVDGHRAGVLVAVADLHNVVQESLGGLALAERVITPAAYCASAFHQQQELDDTCMHLA